MQINDELRNKTLERDKIILPYFANSKTELMVLVLHFVSGYQFVATIYNLQWMCVYFTLFLNASLKLATYKMSKLVNITATIYYSILIKAEAKHSAIGL